MQVREIMTSNPACCRTDAPMQEVAKLMADHDCRPVVDQDDRPVAL